MNMNNEEFDRKMAFIVEQQAQFAADIQQLQEAQVRLQESQVEFRKSQDRTDQVLAHTVAVVGDVGEVVTRLAKVTHAGLTDLNVKINALVDAQIRTEENLARTEKNLSRTEKNLSRTEKNLSRTEKNVSRTEKNVSRTEETLRNFIANVDRRFREGL